MVPFRIIYGFIYASYIWFRLQTSNHDTPLKSARTKNQFHCFMHKNGARDLCYGYAPHFSRLSIARLLIVVKGFLLWMPAELMLEGVINLLFCWLRYSPIINRPATVLTTSLTAQIVCLNLKSCITSHRIRPAIIDTCNIRCNLKNAIAFETRKKRSEKILLVDSNYVNSRPFFFFQFHDSLSLWR